MSHIVKKILKNILIFKVFGFIYILIEIAYRGHTHVSMFFVGGLCALLIGWINEITPDMPMWLQCIFGTVIVVTIEFISGCILNIWLGLGIWDYSQVPFNLLGQICLSFSLAWTVLSYFVIKLDDILRLILGEE